MKLQSPIFNLPIFEDLNGNPLAGGHIYTYDAGSTSVLKDTWTTPVGDVANPNPVVLTASGQLPAGVAFFLTEAEAYNFVLTKSDGTTVLQTFDNTLGVPSGSTGGGGGSTSLWVSLGAATFLTGTSFLVSGNHVSEFYVGNRVRLTQSSNYTYGVVSGSSFSSPNTHVDIINDGSPLNSGLTLAEYSLNVVNGKTVDAGAVSFFDSASYSTSNTVGNKINAVNTALTTSIATTENQRARDALVWTATGVNTYVVTLSPALTSYSTDQHYLIKFTSASTGASTLNINGVGAQPLKMYDSSGALVDVHISAGQLSQVAWSGSAFILLDPLPAAGTVVPRGQQIFTSNGVFTCPAGVSYVKVTCIGGGGGGSAGYATFGPDPHPHDGVSGGCGAMSFTYLPVTAGNAYTVAIGAGGAGGPSTSIPAQDGGQTSFGITLAYAGGGGHGTGQVDGGGTPGANSSVGTGFVITGFPYLTGYGGPGAGGHTTTSSYGVGGAGQAGLCWVEY